MTRSRYLQTFRNKYPFIGPIFWVITLQRFIVEAIVAHAWPATYSWRYNTISDLGNTMCGGFRGAYVCSPLHSVMNVSLVVLGLTMVGGSILIYQEFYKTTVSTLGFGGMALAGLGALLVGFFPENTIGSVHLLGATLAFVFGNLAIVLMALTLPLPSGLRVYSILSGAVALAALGLFVSQTDFGLGSGGTERLVSYTQTLWLIVFGLYISHNHYRTRRRPAA